MENLIGLLIPGVFAIFIVLAILIRVAAGSFDGDRVEQYIRSMGGTLIDKSWDPFGPGWFGEKESRIYQIVYRDRAGYIHRAHVKTSTFSGVYLTNDHIVQNPQPPRVHGTQSPPALPQHSVSQTPPALPTGFSERSPEAIEREKIQLRQRLAELESISPKERGTSGTSEVERR